jgi:catalase
MVKALRFELGKVDTLAIRERMVYTLSQVDRGLAEQVAEGLGIKVPTRIDGPLNKSIPADGNPKAFQPRRVDKALRPSPALSMANSPKDSIKTRKIAVLAADGFDSAALAAMKKALVAAGAQAKIIAPRLGFLTGSNGEKVKIDFSLLTAASVLFDAVFVPGGEASVEALKQEADALHFVNEAYRHCKAIAATGAGVALLQASALGAKNAAKTAAKENQIISDAGVVTSRSAQPGKVAAEFIRAIAQHRHWSREIPDAVPA